MSAVYKCKHGVPEDEYCDVCEENKKGADCPHCGHYCLNNTVFCTPKLTPALDAWEKVKELAKNGGLF